MSDNPKVFISYCHINKDYEQKILAFANRLRNEGIDANVDLYEEAPAEGWQQWMENQIKKADFVLIVNSKNYYEKFYNNQGKGISWEVNIIYQLLYDSVGKNTKFIPVYYGKNDIQYILTPLKSYTYYDIDDDEDFDSLYWRLRGVSKIEKPPLGVLRPLPEKKQKTMFYSSPIDIEKWDLAEWKGIVYIFFPSKAPIMGFLFKNYEMGRSIFAEWKAQANGGFADDFISLTYIVPPFPKGCWVYEGESSNNGNGYIVHVDANITEAFKRAKKMGLEDDELLITTISRFRWMPEHEGDTNRKLLQKMTASGNGYCIMPVGMKTWSYNTPDISEDNLLKDFSDVVRMKKLEFKRGVDIGENDPSNVVFMKKEI